MPSERRRIAVVGATGVVGRETLSILAERSLPVDHVTALASAQSSGELLPYGLGSIPVETLTTERLRQCDAALFCASPDVARAFAPAAAAAGVIVIDNSSAFRADPRVPLVIPEVNGDALRAEPPVSLVANPNCSTTILLVAVEPLRRDFGLECLVVATYQAVSGAGQQGMDELEQQTRAVLRGEVPQPARFPEPCAFNVFSHETSVDLETGLNGEEQKMIAEARRIWNAPEAKLIPTCIRVPVLRAHSHAVTVTLKKSATEREVRASVRSGGGVRVLDDRATGNFPTPLKTCRQDPVFVGRIRRSPAETTDASGRVRTFCLWLSGDQLRKGAALNAIQILDAVFKNSPVPGALPFPGGLRRA